MKNDPRLIPGFILIVVGIILILKTIGIIQIREKELLGYVFLFYGLTATYSTFGSESNRGKLFLSVCIFLFGVLFTVTSQFDFPGYHGIYITSTLFITGSGFLILYFQNRKEFILLMISGALIFLSGTAVLFYSGSSFIQIADRVGGAILNNWEILFILFGFSLFVRRKN